MKKATPKTDGYEDREPEGQDLLISKIIDRQASDQDWQDYDRLEAERPELASEVVQFLRTDALLGLGLNDELDAMPASQLPMSSFQPALSRTRQAAGWATWSGWVTAAALALVLFGSRFGDSAPLSSPQPLPSEHQSELALAEKSAESSAGTPGSEPGSEADSSTRVIEELPLVVIGTRPADDGDGFEVTVLRQVLESRHVEQVLGVARDEEGRPSPVPVDPAAFTPPAVL